MAIVGDILELAYSNSEVGNGFLKCMAKGSHEKNLGGTYIEENKDSITTDGTAVHKMSVSQWQIKAEIFDDYDRSKSRWALEILKLLQNSSVETQFTVKYADQHTKKGIGRPQGDFSSDADGKISLVIGGGGRLK